MMAPNVFVVSLLLLLIPASVSLQLNEEEGLIFGAISEKGLDYAKDLLIHEAMSSIVALQLPQIEKSATVRLVGECKIVLSNITFVDVNITSSYVRTGEKGIVLIASGGTANLSMNWSYSCSTWLLPVSVSDSGDAFVEVKGMQAGMTLNFENQEGSLKLILLDYGCFVGDLSIRLHGGASWLYQRIADLFEGKIASAVEDAISGKIREGISKLSSSLQSLPKEISLGKTAVLNVSYVNNPVLTNSSIEFEINGLFTKENEILIPQGCHREPETSFSCGGLSKMIKISVHENVLNSASLVYFNAGYMQWMVDKLPDQALLNTAAWRFLVPQLYEKYPNKDMELNISVSSPPTIKVTNQDISATIFVDIIVNVENAGEVACISMEVSASCSAEILRNNIAGSLRLNDFSTYLKWSKIGPLHMHLIQVVMSTILRTALLPFVNLLLRGGFPLPYLHGFALQNAHTFYNAPWFAICSDISFLRRSYLSKLPGYV
ncbi:putative BPI/LBP family protein At1g04970 [Prosopis cineraria]|uniref:putative BPI/LBP family protein At1g04970 n=1 Tax=Prosopis cineraria TaxID=364024 RepID=UPI00240EA817|nr:putative BPI/LBP family protein At1g04970 [Prosopis cineraria]